MADLSLNIAEGQIQNAIAVAISEAFSPENRDRMLRDVIRAHLTHKENSYDRETILQKQVGEAIRQMAREKLAALLDTWKPSVDAIVEECLGASFQSAVFAALKSSLGNLAVRNLVISASIMED